MIRARAGGRGAAGARTVSASATAAASFLKKLSTTSATACSSTCRQCAHTRAVTGCSRGLRRRLASLSNGARRSTGAVLSPCAPGPTCRWGAASLRAAPFATRSEPLTLRPCTPTGILAACWTASMHAICPPTCPGCRLDMKPGALRTTWSCRSVALLLARCRLRPGVQRRRLRVACCHLCGATACVWTRPPRRTLPAQRLRSSANTGHVSSVCLGDMLMRCVRSADVPCAYAHFMLKSILLRAAPAGGT